MRALALAALLAVSCASSTVIEEEIVEVEVQPHFTSAAFPTLEQCGWFVEACQPWPHYVEAQRRRMLWEEGRAVIARMERRRPVLRPVIVYERVATPLLVVPDGRDTNCFEDCMGCAPSHYRCWLWERRGAHRTAVTWRSTTGGGTRSLWTESDTVLLPVLRHRLPACGWGRVDIWEREDHYYRWTFGEDRCNCECNAGCSAAELAQLNCGGG